MKYSFFSICTVVLFSAAACKTSTQTKAEKEGGPLLLSGIPCHQSPRFLLQIQCCTIQMIRQFGFIQRILH
jgi:hypothetical protein